MTSKNRFLPCLSLSALPLLLSASVFAKESAPANRISIEQARLVAIKSTSGKIQGEELEFEGGKWIYSFDIKTTHDRNVHEIHVDALSGKLLDSHVETPADEKKEQKEDETNSNG